MLQDAEKQVCYAQHLFNISERYSITVSNDVLNQQGAILIPKGGNLDGNLADKISRHQLQQPLENCVYLHNQLSAKQLMSFYNAIFSKHPNFSKFHQSSNLNDLLIEGCEYYQQFPILKQKMTVLKIQLPKLFKQSLFCAYISLAIAKQINDDSIDCKAVFLAGLTHNIGMLHLDASVLAQKSQYTPQQWHAMHSHSEIAQDILLQISGLPKEIPSAVYEHHERADGSGYPLAKRGESLGLMGQIIGMADTCLSLYKRDLAPKKLGFDALLPVLNLNKNQFCETVFSAMEQIINDVSWSVERIYEDAEMPILISRLMLDNECIRNDLGLIENLVSSIQPYLFLNPQADMLNNMLERLQASIQSSGILKNEHLEWMVISFGAQQRADYLVIERLPITYNEIKWQVRQLKNLLHLMCERNQLKGSGFEKTVKSGLWEMEQYRNQHTLPALH